MHISMQTSEPYPVWVIDEFLEPEVADKLLESWPTDEKGWHNGHSKIGDNKNLLETGMRSMSNIEFIPTLYMDVFSELNSEKNMEFYKNLTGILDLEADQHFRWSGLREMDAGGYQLIHSDARRHIETGYTKALTHLLYLNDDSTYDKETDSGCLEIWNDDLTECVYEIEPKHNRMVIFLNTEKSYHGVPCNRKRRTMLTFSTLVPEECMGRTKALFVARSGIDSENVTIQGLERLNVQDALGKV